MFTVIDKEIYQVNEDKMRKVVIENGVIKTDGKVVNYDKSSNLITMGELRCQYASLFEVKDMTKVSDEELLKELDNKDKEIAELKKSLEDADNLVIELQKQIEELSKVQEPQEPSTDDENKDKEPQEPEKNDSDDKKNK